MRISRRRGVLYRPQGSCWGVRAMSRDPETRKIEEMLLTKCLRWYAGSWEGRCDGVWVKIVDPSVGVLIARIGNAMRLRGRPETKFPTVTP